MCETIFSHADNKRKVNTMPDASLKQIAEFFRKDGETLSQFAAEWKALPEEDKAQLRQGIGDGSLTY